MSTELIALTIAYIGLAASFSAFGVFLYREWRFGSQARAMRKRAEEDMALARSYARARDRELREWTRGW